MARIGVADKPFTLTLPVIGGRIGTIMKTLQRRRLGSGSGLGSVLGSQSSVRVRVRAPTFLCRLQGEGGKPRWDNPIPNARFHGFRRKMPKTVEHPDLQDPAEEAVQNRVLVGVGVEVSVVFRFMRRPVEFLRTCHEQHYPSSAAARFHYYLPRFLHSLSGGMHCFVLHPNGT